jgi:hypothetical protein
VDVGFDSSIDDLVVAKVKQWLAENSNCLLIFDNVQDLNDVLHFTPTTDRGHLLFSMRDEMTAITLARADGYFEILPLALEMGLQGNYLRSSLSVSMTTTVSH